MFTNAPLLIHELTNRIKRIRDNTFCFNIRLRLNPCTLQTRCNSVELHGIRMSEVPPLLLGKWVRIGSLSQNLFCQLQAKGKWLTILESLKKKNKHGQWPQPLTKQTRCSYELKWIYIYGVHLGLLPQTSLGGLCLWVILFLCLHLYLFYSSEALTFGWLLSLSLFLSLILCLHIQFRQICTQVLYSSFLTCIGSMSAYSIPSGYVYKFCILLFWLI